MLSIFPQQNTIGILMPTLETVTSDRS